MGVQVQVIPDNDTPHPLLHRSLADGKRYFNRADLAPIPATEKPARLEEPDRVLVGGSGEGAWWAGAWT